MILGKNSLVDQNEKAQNIQALKQIDEESQQQNVKRKTLLFQKLGEKMVKEVDLYKYK